MEPFLRTKTSMDRQKRLEAIQRQRERLLSKQHPWLPTKIEEGEEGGDGWDDGERKSGGGEREDEENSMLWTPPSQMRWTLAQQPVQLPSPVPSLVPSPVHVPTPTPTPTPHKIDTLKRQKVYQAFNPTRRMIDPHLVIIRQFSNGDPRIKNNRFVHVLPLSSLSDEDIAMLDKWNDSTRTIRGDQVLPTEESALFDRQRTLLAKFMLSVIVSSACIGVAPLMFFPQAAPCLQGIKVSRIVEVCLLKQ